MPRKPQGPYLYLKPGSRKNSPTWVIRDAGKMIYTGAVADDEGKAKAALTEHLRVHHPAPPRPRRTPDIVYFITCDAPDFPIKIGISSRVEWRMHKMQTGLPYDVIVLGTVPGDFTNEKMLHLDFRHLWLRGEWFRRTPELLAHIEDICRADSNTRTNVVNLDKNNQTALPQTQ